MFKTFIILKVYTYIFKLQLQRKYPTLTVRIFVFQLAHIQFQDIFIFKHLRSQAKCFEVSTAWNIPCNSEGRVVLLSVT